MLFQGLFIVATCSVVFLISTLIKSSMVTMALSVVVTVFLTIASQLMVTIKDFAHLIFVNYADGISILTGSSALTFNNPNMTVQNGIIIMIATSVISYIIAHINFTRYFNLIKIIILYKLINNKLYQEKICIFLIFDNYKIRTPKWCAIFVI